MNLQRFVSTRHPDWDRLHHLIGDAKGRPDRLGAAGVRELGPLYRAVVADVAQLRLHFPNDPITKRLEQTALQARQLVYDTQLGRRRPWSFLTRGYFEVVRSRPAPLAVAAFFLLVPAVLVAIWAVVDPSAASGLVPSQFRSALAPGTAGTDAGLSAGEQAAFSTFLITNNIQVAVLAFAAGMFWCLGTVIILVLNGMVLGAVAGVLISSGNTAFFVELVAAHGVLELSAVVVAAAAGLRMGWALVDPGLATRREALAEQARAAVLIVVGTMPWFVLAGIIEAFVSRRGLPAAPMAIIGLLVGLFYWSLVYRRGRQPADQRRALALAST